MSLTQHIKQQLKQRGEMSFAEFMHQALYAPYAGYYSSGLQKFGMQGDFITAPELTPLFGQTLANQCLQILSHLTQPIIFEFGAGSGRLCIDILQRLEQLNGLPDEYHILEVSAALQARQQELILAEIPHLAPRIKWLNTWPSQAFNGVVIANEVLDAMPVERFLQTSEGVKASFIRLDEHDVLIECFKPCTDERLLNHVHHVLPADLIPYQSEVNLFIPEWINSCYGMLNQGAVFLIDYGFPRHEYYHPDRDHGTLMCHFQHRSHPNALIHIGEQDITAHVDFTHVAEAGVAAGFHVAGYTNQAAFLLANGILNLVSELPDNAERIQVQQKLKQLIQPTEMGELFKVIALTKDLDLTLNGFLLQDKRVSL